MIETVSEEICIGRVEVEPRPLKNGEIHDLPTLGRVSYDKHGVCEIFLFIRLIRLFSME